MNFSFVLYKKMILDLKSCGFKFSNFADYSKDKKVYLRHDIDIYSENALNLAMVEKECEVSAVYFFQIDSTFYNILSDEIITSIIKIKELGHEIGLHVNPHKVQNSDELMGKIIQEYTFYKNYLPLSKIISFHKPPDFIFENLQFDGFINVYGDKYFKDIRYLSDSDRREIYINLNESLEKDEDTSIQLLTHPYWWDHISLDVYQTLQRLLETKKVVFTGKLKEEILPYKDFLDYRFYNKM
jgi:hypothetical protein